jgi:phospholipid/cholesterol/gamma-HCH transport system substrate-binding protein
LTGLNVPDRIVRVTMIIERDRLASIPVDSTAQASAETLVGDKFVDIDSGKSGARLGPGGTLTYKAAPDITKRLDITQFQERLRDLDVLMTQIESGEGEVGRLVKGDEMYQVVMRRIRQVQASLDAVRATANQMGQALYTDTLHRQIESQIQGVDQGLAKIQSGQGSLGLFLRDEGQYASLRSSVADLRKSIQEVRAGDFFTSDQQYADWNTTVQKLIRAVDEFATSPMIVGTDTYENLVGMAKEMQTQMKDFRENPRKYLRLKVF